MSYAGDISVEDAWQMLQDDPKTMLIDVRTAAEWAFVGVPDLTGLGKDLVSVSWQTLPAMQQNPNFVDEVKNAGATPESKLLFICRSGARSRSSAMALTAAGFSHSYNVAGGFEGDLDEHRHRGATGGWKAAGLPWVQS